MEPTVLSMKLQNDYEERYYSLAMTLSDVIALRGQSGPPKAKIISLPVAGVESKPPGRVTQQAIPNSTATLIKLSNES